MSSERTSAGSWCVGTVKRVQSGAFERGGAPPRLTAQRPGRAHAFVRLGAALAAVGRDLTRESSRLGSFQLSQRENFSLLEMPTMRRAGRLSF